MKNIIFFSLFMLLISQPLMAQIVGNNAKELKKVKEKKIAPTYAFIDFNHTNSFRDLSQNTDFLAVPLGERAHEVPLKVWSYQLGMNTGIKPNLRFEGGMKFLQTGEQYSYQGSLGGDSTFNSQSKYRYLSMPLQLKWEKGNQFRFSIGGGLQAQLYINYLQKQQWTTSLSGPKEAKIEQNISCNSFALSALGEMGVHYFGKNNYGVFCKMTYRYQITNTYIKTADYQHLSKGLGLSFGLSKNIE